MPISHDPTAALQRVFGFKGFRHGQERVIRHLLDGKSSLAIFPTGAGKSLCYQLPAVMLDGIALVVSPLIALMKDQIDFLTSKGIPAARLDSSQDLAVARQVTADLRAGKLKLLYIAPERFASERFLQMLGRMPISLMAIDEAHCISEWGHNFRPDYLKLAAMARQLRIPRVLALTATATPSVAKNIAEAFAIAPDCVVHTGFHRPNLFLQVTSGFTMKRRSYLISRLRARPRGPTIVYVTLQKTAEILANALADADLPAKAYHAGLDADLRHEIQDWFMASPDAIVVATIAFGMGIDKPDIRYIYHYNLPKSLENYAQEIGRAGRDGKPSTCELLASARDLITLSNFTYGDTPDPQAVGALVDEILGKPEMFDVSVYELSNAYDIRPLVVDTILTYLELDDLIESTGPFYSAYKFQPLKSSAEIFARFDNERAEFLRGIFKHAKKAQVWFTLDIDKIAAALKEPRGRIISAISYLEEQGDLVLEVAGIRQGYRRKRMTVDAPKLKRAMADRFLQREKRDIARLNGVMEFASHQGCRTRFLLSYFGEDLGKGCGHCAWCGGERPGRVPAPHPAKLGATETALVRKLRREYPEILSSPRAMARFLCGLTSPKATKARLSRHEDFGALSDVPFLEVLSLAGG